MNVFYLDADVTACAQYHCDKHIVKMIVEYAQLLSTAHRILDGSMSVVERVNKKGKNRKVKVWTLSIYEKTFYAASHINHPSAIWCRSSTGNYRWLYNLFVELCKEYTRRYGKIHKCETVLRDALQIAPFNCKSGEFTEPPLAMKSEPQCINDSDKIGSYRAFYRTKEKRMKMTWKTRDEPFWYRQEPDMWLRLKRGHILGVVDSNGAVHSEFTGSKVAFHAEHFGEHHCKWRWSHSESIWWISSECKPSEEQYSAIQEHLSKKYGLKWWDNGHHDIDHLQEKWQAAEAK